MKHLSKTLLSASFAALLLGQAHPVYAASSGNTYASTGALAKGAAKSGVRDIAPASNTLKRGLKALDKRDMKAALAARSALRAGTLERKVMAWAIAMNGRGVDPMLLNTIASDLANWPGAKTMRGNIERALVNSADTNSLRVAFSQAQPETDEAAIALAFAHAKAGQRKAARKAIAPVWHKSKLTSSQEKSILKRLGGVLTKADHRARVEYLLSRNRLRGAGRLASKAGMTRLVAARVAVQRKSRNASKVLAAVPAFQRKDPLYLFSKARHLRHQDKLSAATKTLLAVSPKSIHPNARDDFWTEKRILASDLLEAKRYKSAYRLASRNVAGSATKRIDAEFYAGWLALRKLKDAGTAQRHFARLLEMATTPLSKSRGHYWMGRALSKAGSKKSAVEHYAHAARHDTTFYGQLAASRLGRNSIRVSKARPTRTERSQFTRFELVQAIKKLESAGHPRRARTIYRFLSRHMTSPGELALLSARAEKRRDYQLALQVGKIGFRRGFDVDNLSWPVGAIPRKTKTSGAGLPLAYAIARQESTFQVDARSSANALGLLQLLPTTAKRTAQNIGIKYSRNRLVTDAGYNARLGTAYLSKQMDTFGGSFVLTFAAYNAGPGRAKDWIERNGDPRGKSVDYVVDWIEKIPFSETRNYVQRVMENYQVYKTRLKGGKLTIERDITRGRSN